MLGAVTLSVSPVTQVHLIAEPQLIDTQAALDLRVEAD